MGDWYANNKPSIHIIIYLFQSIPLSVTRICVTQITGSRSPGNFGIIWQLGNDYEHEADQIQKRVEQLYEDKDDSSVDMTKDLHPAKIDIKTPKIHPIENPANHLNLNQTSIWLWVQHLNFPGCNRRFCRIFFVDLLEVSPRLRWRDRWSLPSLGEGCYKVFGRDKCPLVLAND